MIRLSDLLGQRVVAENGSQLGHVYDVRVRRQGDDWQVSGVVIGSRGVAERLGLRTGRRAEPLLSDGLIPWDAVLRIDDAGLVVRDGQR